MNNKCQHFFCSKHSMWNRKDAYAVVSYNGKTLNVCRDHLAPVEEMTSKYGFTLTTNLI